METLRVVCMAYSRKHGGRCFAGIRVDGGGWVRPVSIKDDGSLTYIMCQLDDGAAPKLLDVIDIGMKRPKPLPYQPENWLIDRSPWKLVRRPATLDERRLCLSYVTQGPELFGSTEDRVLEHAQIASSLTLARVSDLQWSIRRNTEGQRKVRVRFALGEAEYALGLTDDDLEARLRELPIGDHPMRACPLFEQARNAVLTLSLGEPFQGHCYKLVAGVLATG